MQRTFGYIRHYFLTFFATATGYRHRQKGVGTHLDVICTGQPLHASLKRIQWTEFQSRWHWHIYNPLHVIETWGSTIDIRGH